MAVKAISARNSAVTSTTVEAVAVDQLTPSSVTARAPKTKPPTVENGRQLVAASRTIRPQMKTPSACPPCGGTITNQPTPRITNKASCQATMTPNWVRPTLPSAAATLPKPK